MSVLRDLLEGIRGGGIEVLDLTAPLTEKTPILGLPEQFGQTATFSFRRSAGTTTAARPGTGTTSPPGSTPAPTSTPPTTG